jgi:hypothetical protein
MGGMKLTISAFQVDFGDGPKEFLTCADIERLNKERGSRRKRVSAWCCSLARVRVIRSRRTISGRTQRSSTLLCKHAPLDRNAELEVEMDLFRLNHAQIGGDLSVILKMMRRSAAIRA